MKYYRFYFARSQMFSCEILIFLIVFMKGFLYSLIFLKLSFNFKVNMLPMSWENLVFYYELVNVFGF